jgi:hypothetical protein
MTSLEDKINKLETKIGVIEILLDFISLRKPGVDVSMPIESNGFPHYQDLAQQQDGQKQLRDELKQLRDELIVVKQLLLLQERGRGMSSIYYHYFDYEHIEYHLTFIFLLVPIYLRCVFFVLFVVTSR